jgi:hypothetical protein
MKMDKNSTFLRWSRRLALSLLSIILTLVMITGGIVVVLEESDYRDALVWAADRFLDARLEINGPLSFRLARETALDAEDIRLQANDESYTLVVGQLHIRQRLGSYLRTGTLWISKLVLSGVKLNVQAGKGDTGDFHLEELPPVIIEEARLAELKVVYQGMDPGLTHQISLQQLVIDDVNNSGPIGIRGKGQVDGETLTVSGSLGPLADLLVREQPYALELALKSKRIESRLSGTIADPLRGTGMDLEFTGKDTRPSQTLKLFNENAPELGVLSVATRIRGDYTAPRFEKIAIRLQREETVDLSVKGEIGNILTLAGLDLSVTGHSSDPAVLSWLLFEDTSRLDWLKIAAHVRGQHGEYRIEDLDAAARSMSGLELRLTGNSAIPRENHAGGGHAVASLDAVVSAPSLAALDLRGGGDVPEAGPVRGKAKLTPYRDGFSLSGIHASIGGEEKVLVRLQGTIDFIPYSSGENIKGLDLQADLKAADSTSIGRLMDYPLPELGAVRAEMHLSGNLPELLIDKVRLSTGNPEQPTVRATGTVRTKLRQHTTTLEINFDVAVADLLAAYGKLPPGYLGRLGGSVQLSDLDGTWGLDQFTVASTQTKLYQLDFSGALDDIVKRDQAEVRIRISIPDPPALGAAAGVDLAGIAAYRAEGVLSLEGKRLHYQGSGSLGRTTSKTQLHGSLVKGHPRLQGKFEIPVLYLTDFGIHPALGGTTGKTDLAGSGSEEKPARQYLFSRKPLDLEYLKKIDLDLDISVDSIDAPGLSAQQLTGHVSLEGGQLHIAPMRLVAEGGPTDLDLEIDARGKPRFTLKLSADDQLLGPWLSQVQKDVPVDGYANYQIFLQGIGASPHELASSLNGLVYLAFENVRIPQRYVNYLSADVFGWVMDSTIKQEAYADLDCVLARFDVTNGTVTSKVLIADGPRLAVEGSLTLNLEAETINLVVLPKQKHRLFSDIAPVRVTGDIRDPEVHAIPAKAAITSIGPLFLLPTVAIPVMLFDKLWSTVDDHDAQGGGCARIAAAKEAASKTAK